MAEPSTRHCLRNFKFWMVATATALSLESSNSFAGILCANAIDGAGIDGTASNYKCTPQTGGSLDIGETFSDGVLISAPGSVVVSGSDLNVGFFTVIGVYGPGSMTVQNGTVTTVGLTDGGSGKGGDNGSLSVLSGGRFVVTSDATVGYTHTGTLNLSGGGVLTTDSMVLGALLGSTGIVTVDGK